MLYTCTIRILLFEQTPVQYGRICPCKSNCHRVLDHSMVRSLVHGINVGMVSAPCGIDRTSLSVPFSPEMVSTDIFRATVQPRPCHEATQKKRKGRRSFRSKADPVIHALVSWTISHNVCVAYERFVVRSNAKYTAGSSKRQSPMRAVQQSA